MIRSADSDMDSDRRRFFFCHIHKTGGSSLIQGLRRHFGSDRVYPAAQDGPAVRRVLSIQHLRERWALRSDEIDVVAAHFPLCTRELLGVPFTTITVFREPVARTLSYLRHHRKMTPADRHRTLEAIYDDRFRFEALIHNHMVKMLALRPDEMKGGALTPMTMTRAHLERAQARLPTIDLIGTQTRFEAIRDQMRQRFGIDLGPPIFINRTRPEPVSSAFRNRILDDNALDVELYDTVCRLLS